MDRTFDHVIFFFFVLGFFFFFLAQLNVFFE